MKTLSQTEVAHVAGGGSPFPSPFFQGGFWFGYQMPVPVAVGVAF